MAVFFSDHFINLKLMVLGGQSSISRSNGGYFERFSLLSLQKLFSLGDPVFLRRHFSPLKKRRGRRG